MMKAVVLDGFAFSAGDVDLTRLKSLCDITYYNRTPAEKTVKRIGSAQIIFTNKVMIDKHVIDSCPDLRYIGVLATGYNVIDTEYAREKGICVTNIPAYSTEAVAQHVFAFILYHFSKIHAQSDSVKLGEWERCENFCYFPADTSELSGKTLGVLGLGSIGTRVCEIAQVFGMNVLAHTRTPKELCGVKLVSFETLCKKSDVVSLHCPLTPQTEHIINDKALSMFKPSAMLINTSRGAALDEKAVADALNAGKLACAAVDVLSEEPPHRGSPLLTAKNCVITPHTAWAPLQTRQRCIDIAADNLQAFLDSKPINRVN